ncbi:Hypp1613 [Branchiostoma lanceolatum]|uniref:Hypp1613 protein n=1 Tax=Branchiostoma lanceolatum TaxID=7740 RepID=A0A8K0ELK7_BRALA|nr:Hypp1613 [Branchiostoma lanceolatum]
MSGPASERVPARGWAAMVIVLTGLALARAEGQAEDLRYPDSDETAAFSDPVRDYLQKYGNVAARWLPDKRVAEYVFGHGRTNDLENRQRMAWLHKVISTLESAGSKS